MGILRSHRFDEAIVIAPKSEDSFFLDYRKTFPTENFETFDLEGLAHLFEYELAGDYASYLRALGVEGLPRLELLLPRFYLAKDYPAYSDVYELGLKLGKDGFLRRRREPNEVFSDKIIIIKGYYYGKAIANVLQDLPNISVNYDFFPERLLDKAKNPVPIRSIDEIRMEDLPNEVISVCVGEGVEPLNGLSLKTHRGLYAPSGGSFIAIIRGDVEDGYSPLSEEEKKAFRYETLPEKQKRMEVEKEALLKSPRLYKAYLLS